MRRLALGGKISGRVTAADTGQPFTDGSVAVYDAEGQQVGTASIATDGSYTVLDGLATGSYRVGVIPNAGSYGTSFYGSGVTLQSARSVALTAPNTASGIDIVMLRGDVSAAGQAIAASRA